MAKSKRLRNKSQRLNMSDALQGDVLAEETHSGRAWSLIILLALIGPMIGVALVPSTAGRWAGRAGGSDRNRHLRDVVERLSVPFPAPRG